MFNLMHDLYSMMDEEIDGAETYAEKAISCKETMPDLAKTFHQMSLDEMKHASTIEAEIKRVIAAEKTKNPQEVTGTMDMIYSFMHDQFAMKVVKIQMMQTKFKEM